MSKTIQLKSDFVFIVPPAHLATHGITVVDYTNINASTLEPVRKKVSLAKCQEMVFLALLQGYQVASDEDKTGFTLIRIYNKDSMKEFAASHKLVVEG